MEGKPISSHIPQITVNEEPGTQKALDDLHRFIMEASDPFSVIHGNSQAIKEVVSYAKLVAKRDTPVLLKGESGTGKELFARAIHNFSPRRADPFIPVNCGNFPEDLLESELFGYERGAFTGAKHSGKLGLFEVANKGTIFLDEIAELSIQLQAKLLRVLQENRIRRVGGIEEKVINVRIISATNQDIEKMVLEGSFREDLYYRINVVPLLIPPLRCRREDIRILTDYFLSKYSIKFNIGPRKLSNEAFKKLYNYAWPGNVRELQNVIERTLIIAQSEVVRPEDIEIRDFYAGFSDFGRDFTEKNNTLKEMLEKVELEIIAESYKRHGSSRKVAEDLGVTHTSISKKLKKIKNKQA
ncbi:MAG: sigma 54-interacting transcriptional regulator [Bacillota bacterium]